MKRSDQAAVLRRQAVEDDDLLTSVPLDILQAIGAVAVNFAQLEESLSHAIWFLIADRNEGVQLYHRAITAELSFRQRVWMYANTFKERYNPSDVWLQGIVKRCFELEASRNAFLHSVWRAWIPKKPGSAIRLKASARHRVVTKRHDHSRGELVHLARSLRFLGAEIESAALNAFANRVLP